MREPQRPEGARVPLGRWALFRLLVIFGLGLVARFHNLPEVLMDGRFYFVDADCYSRMSRVREVALHPGTVVRRHLFENWPDGVESHATSPLDYLIYGLSLPVRILTPTSGRWAVLEGQSLDVAGALVGPILGMCACLAVALGVGAFGTNSSTTRGRIGAEAAVLVAAVSPALAHATGFGRPDHQALLVAALAWVLAGEASMAAGAGRGWAWGSGMAMGLALWVSLFEPAIFFVLVLGCSALGWRQTWTVACRRPWFFGFFGVLALGFWVDGMRVAVPEREFWEVLKRWGGSIAELQGVDSVVGLLRWSGGLLLGVPLAAVLVWRSPRARTVWAWMLLLAVPTALTLWQIRWSPYFVLVFAFVVPALLECVPNRNARAALFCAALWPIAEEWDVRCFPPVDMEVDRHLDRSERVNLRLTAERMRSGEVVPFVAPWWHAPALAYWSGQPAVGGSSHEGIAGIRDSAEIYLGSDPAAVRSLLHQKKVALIVAGDRARIVQNCRQLLGKEPEGKPLAEILWSADIPPDWGMVGESNVTTFRLVRVLP